MAYNPEAGEQQGIRSLVEAVQRDVTFLQGAADHHDASAQLVQSWGALVRWLALGPAPKTNPCPVCGKTVMAEATTCGYCWARINLPE